jgi:PAS domain S-box-containing protein
VPDLTEDLRRHVNLRRRAALRVGGADGGGALGLSASAALGVLHRLASSPATATEALSLLHELQVHQVELELQDEELRASRAELETLVNRHRQLYDGSPAGSFAIDQATVITELNLAGVRLLGSTRAAAIGRRFDSLVADDDKRVLQALLNGAEEGREGAQCELRISAADGTLTRTRLIASVDPAGPGYILASLTAGDAPRI